MRVGLALGLIVGAALLGATAQAAIPDYDVKAQCDRMARADGTLSQAVLMVCMQQEQAAYDKAKDVWGNLPRTSQEHCAQTSLDTGQTSYIILNACVQQENYAASMPKENFEFHR